MVRRMPILASLFSNRYRFIAQLSLFEDIVIAVVSDSANVATIKRYNFVEQSELGIDAIPDVEPISLERFLHHGTFIIIATSIGRDVYARWHIAIDFEVCVQSPLN